MADRLLRRGSPLAPGRARASARRPEVVRLGLDPLEDRRMLAVAPVETVFHDLVSVEVVDRHLFYNNSSYDGNDPAANAADAAAIATDKTALLPTETASFANYSSYSRGINGVIIDIAGLPSYTLSADDFEFRVGNTNDPSSWTDAPIPQIFVQAGAGAGGSVRVKLIWNDGAIVGQWLQVTVKATPATGLETPDVFYFGNAVGETGNSAADAIVDATDVQGAANNPRGVGNPAPIDFAYDFNRDTLVDATDEQIATDNATTGPTALQLIDTPEFVPELEYQRPPITLYNRGDNGHPAHFSPTLVTTKAGTVLAFIDAWANSHDQSSYAILVRRSTDNGVTFEPATVAYGVPPGSGDRIAATSVVVEQTTGKIIVMFTRDVRDVLVMTSTDDGLTWTEPVDITLDVTVSEGSNPGPPGMFPDIPWGWIAVGPGHGIQLQNGPHAGRLIFTADHRQTVDNTGPSWSHIMYSDDLGETWNLGGGLPYDHEGGPSPNDYSNENQVVELSNGDLYMTIRINIGNENQRGASWSTDGGITWSDMVRVPALRTPEVHGSIIRLNDGVILFAAPTNRFNNFRRGLTIWASYDDAQTWTTKRTVFFGFSAYSDMTVVGPDTILVAYNRGFTGGKVISSGTSVPEWRTETALARVNLQWLEGTDPYQFIYHFNEGAPGEDSNTSGASIQDYGPWDQRAAAFNLINSPAPKYVAGANGDSALQLTDDRDEVVLSQGEIEAFQFDVNDSFTIEITMKTSDADGVVIGTQLGIHGWRLSVVDGKLQFVLNDGTNAPTITSDATIHDGQWHRITVVRNALKTGNAQKTLNLFVDGAPAATTAVDTTFFPRDASDPDDPVILGADSSLSVDSQLAMTIDTLRITRAALAPEEFLPEEFVAPTQPPAPEYTGNAPTSIPGLQLWLPPYDPTQFWGDWQRFANPLPLNPFNGMASRSMIDLSLNEWRIFSAKEFNSILYGEDEAIGPHWQYTAKSHLGSGSELKVRNSSGIKETNFDFVQNNGEFTLSAFINVKANTGGFMTIFDTNEGVAGRAGFSFLRQHDGRISLLVTGGTPETIRFSGPAPGGAMALQTWYHVAAVGNGPGNPIKFYVTPVDDKTITEYTSTSTFGGSNGTYATDVFHDLYIGGRSGQNPGAQPFNGGMVNQTIFDRALSPLEIQKLFQYGKALSYQNAPWLNKNVILDVNNDGNVFPIDALQVINRLILDGTGPLPNPSAGDTPPPFVDVSGNGSLEPLDALILINWLILRPNGGGSVAVPPAASEDGGVSPAVAAGFSEVSTEPSAEPLSASQEDVSASTLVVSPATMVKTTSPQEAPVQAMVVNAFATSSGSIVPISNTIPTASESDGSSTATSTSGGTSHDAVSAELLIIDSFDADRAPALLARDEETDSNTGVSGDSVDKLAADAYYAEFGIWD